MFPYGMHKSFVKLIAYILIKEYLHKSSVELLVYFLTDLIYF